MGADNTKTQTSATQGVPLGEIPADQQPIDNKFWFAMSRTWVTAAETNIEKQATKIQDAIKWFFSLGVAATILGLFLKDKTAGEIDLFWLGVSLFCLFVAYATSTLAVTLSSKTIEQPNNDSEIRVAFNSSIKKARVFLVISSLTLVFGMGLIAPALYAAYNSQPGKEKAIVTATASYTVKIAKSVTTVKNKKIEKTDTLLNEVFISASVKDSAQLFLKVDTGRNFTMLAPALTLKHTTAHKGFDLIYAVQKPVKLTAKTQLFLSLTYKESSDSLATKIVQITPH